MGNGAVKSRYLGGKTFPKIYKEEIYPVNEELFEKLRIPEGKGFELFRAFAKIDLNENQLVDVQECFRFMGGARSRFTERIFYPFEDRQGVVKDGLKFREFVIVSWAFCTLTPAGLARYVFEIFDPDGRDSLEAPDLDAMYRMLHHCESADAAVAAQFPCDSAGKIYKEAFCTICGRGAAGIGGPLGAAAKVLLAPAIEHQQRLRKKLGGSLFWDSLMRYRSRQFAVYDQQSDTLSEALVGIITSEGERHKLTREAAGSLLERQKAKLTHDAELAERELHLRERQLENERRMAALYAEDRKMNDAWAAFEARKRKFEVEEYLVEDIWRRHADREELYMLFDEAVEEQVAYFEWKDAKDTELTEGTEADHEARYQDYLKTLEGQVVLDLKLLINTLQQTVKSLMARYERGKLPGGKDDEEPKPEKVLLAENYIGDLERSLHPLLEHDDKTREGLRQHERDVKLAQSQNLDEERRFAKKLARRNDLKQADMRTNFELCAMLKEKTMKKFHEQLAQAQELRERKLKKIEMDIAMNFGSRITRWEFVLDKEANRPLYVNVDTLAGRHHKTAICEECDAIMVQAELRCIQCDAPRSHRNMALYRPLGFKDITLE